jgi:hypothetical protein
MPAVMTFGKRVAVGYAPRMDSTGDAWAYPFSSPGWFGTMVLQGLILIIPIVGQISLLGWLLVTIDNLRAGRRELAPAGFHLRRGIALFGVELIYGVAISIIPVVLLQIGSLVRGSGGAALLAVGSLLALAAYLLLLFLTPALILRTSQLGFGGGMDIQAVWRQATADVGQTVIAALLYWVAGLIAGLGLILCFVGVYLTTVYSNAVIAGIVSWYERTQPAPSPSAAT